MHGRRGSHPSPAAASSCQRFPLSKPWQPPRACRNSAEIPTFLQAPLKLQRFKKVTHSFSLQLQSVRGVSGIQIYRKWRRGQLLWTEVLHEPSIDFKSSFQLSSLSSREKRHGVVFIPVWGVKVHHNLLMAICCHVVRGKNLWKLNNLDVSSLFAQGAAAQLMDANMLVNDK